MYSGEFAEEVGRAHAILSDGNRPTHWLEVTITSRLSPRDTRFPHLRLTTISAANVAERPTIVISSRAGRDAVLGRLREWLDAPALAAVPYLSLDGVSEALEWLFTSCIGDWWRVTLRSGMQPGYPDQVKHWAVFEDEREAALFHANCC